MQSCAHDAGYTQMTNKTETISPVSHPKVNPAYSFTTFNGDKSNVSSPKESIPKTLIIEDYFKKTVEYFYGDDKFVDGSNREIESMQQWRGCGEVDKEAIGQAYKFHMYENGKKRNLATWRWNDKIIKKHAVKSQRVKLPSIKTIFKVAPRKTARF